VDEAVADRVRVCRLGDVAVEAAGWDLAADDGGAVAVAVVEDLEEVAALSVMVFPALRLTLSSTGNPPGLG
jgi:hypothetical protein